MIDINISRWETAARGRSLVDAANGFRARRATKVAEDALCANGIEPA